MLPSVHVQPDWYLSQAGEKFWINVEESSEKIFADALVGPNNSLQVTDGVTAQIIPHATLGSFLSVTTPKGNKFWFQPPSHSDLRFKGKTINFIDVAGSLILRAEGSTVGVWSLDDTGPSPWRKLVGHAGDVYVSKFFPSGKVALTAGADCTLRVWDLVDFTEGEWDALFAGHSGGVLGADFVERGRNIVSCSRDRTVKLWDVPTQKPIHSFNTDSCANAVKVFTSTLASTGAPVDERDVGTEGKLIVVATEDSAVLVFDLRSRAPVSKIETPGPANTCVGMNDIIVAGTQTGHISVFDLRKQQALYNVQRELSPVNHVVQFNDQCVVVGHNDCTVYLWDIGEKTSKLELLVPEDERLYALCATSGVVYTGRSSFQVDLSVCK